MEETTINVAITLAFQDSTSRTYTFSGVEEEAVSDVKDKVLAINANMSDAFKTTFVSNGGSQCVMISAAKIISITEEVIYSAG